MNEPGWQAVAGRIAAAAAEVGFDLMQPFNVGHYNADAATAERLDDGGRSDALGVLLGNTRRLWPLFTRAYALDPELARARDPLDAYVVTRVGALVAAIVPAGAKLVFAHSASPRAFPIQRLAERSGLASVSPSYLAIHPDHGPWLAFRAVVIVDVPGPQEPPSLRVSPCLACSAPCVPALKHALAASGTPLSSASIAAHANVWIAVRDACPVGRHARYGENQLAYHYAPTPQRIVPET